MSAYPQDWQCSSNDAVISLSEIYARYGQFVKEFHAASGPRRERMTLEEFAEWWCKLSEKEQADHYARFEAGYGKMEEGSRGRRVELIAQYLSQPPAK